MYLERLVTVIVATSLLTMTEPLPGNELNPNVAAAKLEIAIETATRVNRIDVMLTPLFVVP